MFNFVKKVVRGIGSGLFFSVVAPIGFCRIMVKGFSGSSGNGAAAWGDFAILVIGGFCFLIMGGVVAATLCGVPLPITVGSYFAACAGMGVWSSFASKF